MARHGVMNIALVIVNSTRDIFVPDFDPMKLPIKLLLSGWNASHRREIRIKKDLVKRRKYSLFSFSRNLLLNISDSRYQVQCLCQTATLM